MQRNGKIITNKSSGYTTLLFTLVVFIIFNSIIVYSSYSVINQQRLLRHENNINQAFEAAEAGAQYGIAYLNANTAAVASSFRKASNPTTASFSVAGINPPLTTSDGSQTVSFSVNYSLAAGASTSPAASFVIQISSTGLSLDNDATYTITKQTGPVAGTGGGGNVFSYSVTLMGNITKMVGGADINTDNGQGLRSGPTVPAGYRNNIHGTVVDNQTPLDYTLANADALFLAAFGQTRQAVYNSADYVLVNNPDFGALPANLPAGTLIWVTGSATLHGTLGTQDTPVILIVNGDLLIKANSEFYGVAYAANPLSSLANGIPVTLGSTGSIQLTGGASSGSVAAEGALSMNGSTALGRDQNILDVLFPPNYAPIPGGWKDY